MANLTEAKIEMYLVDQIKRLGGEAYKFTSPARRNVPDRICVLPRRLVVFVECKQQRGSLTKGQVKELERLKNLDQIMIVVHNFKEVDELIQMIRSVLSQRPEVEK